MVPRLLVERQPYAYTSGAGGPDTIAGFCLDTKSTKPHYSTCTAVGDDTDHGSVVLYDNTDRQLFVLYHGSITSYTVDFNNGVRMYVRTMHVGD